MLCWLTLASKLLGCFCLHAFLSGREFNTWIFSSVPQKNMDGILKNIQYWPPPKVNATTPGNFSRSGRAKQELWNLTLNTFWDFPRKYWEINQKFPLLSVLTSTLSSLSSTDGGWEVGSTYIRSNTWELFWGEMSPSECKMLLSSGTLPVPFGLSWVSATMEKFHQRTQHTVIVSDWSFALSEGFRLNQSQLL